MVATLVLAVAVGVVRGGDDGPRPGATVSTLAAPESGDSAAFAISPPREPVSVEEWSDVLPRLQEAAEGPEADAADRRRLALALYNLGRLDEAKAVYQGLLAQGEDAVARNRLGNVLRDQGDLAAAEEAYRLATETDPALPAPYVNLAEILWQLHRDEEALAVLDQADAAVPTEALPAIERAREALTGVTTSTDSPASGD